MSDFLYYLTFVLFNGEPNLDYFRSFIHNEDSMGIQANGLGGGYRVDDVFVANHMSNCRETVVNLFDYATDHSLLKKFYVRIILDRDAHIDAITLLKNHSQGNIFISLMEKIFMETAQIASLRIENDCFVLETLGPGKVSKGDLSLLLYLIRHCPILEVCLNSMSDKQKTPDEVFKNMAKSVLDFSFDFKKVSDNLMRPSDTLWNSRDKMFSMLISGYVTPTDVVQLSMYLFYMNTIRRVTRRDAVNGMLSSFQLFMNSRHHVDEFVEMAYPTLNSERENLFIRALNRYGYLQEVVSGSIERLKRRGVVNEVS